MGAPFCYLVNLLKLCITLSTSMNDVRLDLYEVPTDEELVTITFLDRLATKLGNPPDINSEAGLKLLDGIIGVWFKHFPQEAKDWAHDRKIDLATEKSIKELISDKSAGYNPVGYPPMLFKLIKAMFPEIKLQNKKVFTKLIQIYPDLFSTSNYV